MAKRMIIMLISVGIVLGIVFTWEAVISPMFLKKFIASMANPPQTVSTAKAVTQDWQKEIVAVGSLRAQRGADLSTQVGGIVSAVHFESGAEVEAGTLLVELSSADDVAKLNSLKAAASLAQTTYDRDQRQLQAQAVSRQVVDTDEGNLRSAQAQVAQQQAIIDYKFIKAPFSGRLGIRQIDVGQYVSPGLAIVSLQALDPIYVDFTLPQQNIAQIKTGQKVTALVDSFPGVEFTGTIAALNSRIDTATRNIQVRATIPNPDHKLLPGMFTTVRIAIGDVQKLVTLPQTSITYNPYGSTIFIVDQKKDDNGKDTLNARQVFVTAGDTRGDQVSVLKGVNDGETVVTAGQLKLRNGSPLNVNNEVQPSNDPNPKPANQ
jgi:membrane fusion protein (multidrug efflux system)